ncbi:caspase recruitment domain-containing protein 10-like [Dreissena polymorpha]|uniref:caspase recruitment domain-containing protein 10-like n=1 Tax=Dreissena polymorpha TaxID=45954 RepID=UPI00226468ED|nr:caspase recruitment domain-containing protein 10-like [Dreissena polymorpha]
MTTTVYVRADLSVNIMAGDKDEDEKYHETLTENFYLFSKYLVPEDYIAELVSASVLTLEDREVILNHFVNQTRRQRANRFIEVLMTKGRRGFEKFVELLEYRCPHVYREVAKREPRDPPAGFPRNRFSDRLRIINDLPHLLEQIKDSLTDSSDLEVKLCTLHGLLEDAKDENLALEKEVETLKNVRIELDQLRHTNTAQEKQVSDLTKEVTSWMHKAYTHSEKENELRDSNQELRIQCDELQRKLRELGTVEKPVERSPIPRNPSIELSQFEQRRVIHMNEERLILREELENYKEQCQELNQRLDTAQREDFDLREQLSKQEHEMHILQKQNKILKKKHKEEDAIVIQQFEQIQKKGQEILELEAQCIKDRSRVCELQTEKNMWIEEQHLLRQEIRHLRNELDSLRCLIRSSGSSQTGTTSEEEDCIEADKKRKLFARRKPVQKATRGEKYAEVITRQKLTKAQNRMDQSECTVNGNYKWKMMDKNLRQYDVVILK